MSAGDARPIRPRGPDDLPETVPVFPLNGALLLPETRRPLNVFEPRYLALVDHALAADRLIGLVQPADAAEESPPGRVALRSVGCLGRLTQFEEADDDRYVIVLDGVCRFDILGEVRGRAPFRRMRISAARFADDFDPDHDAGDVDRGRFLKVMRAYATFAGLDLDWDEIERTGTADLVNLCAMLSPYGPAEKQLLLEADSLAHRAEALIAMAEVEMARAGPGHVLQ